MPKYILSFLYVTLGVHLLFAQTIDLDLFKNMQPRSIGPAGMSGRVTAIDVNLRQPNMVYIGTASGGVWKSENGGSSWKPIFDDAPIQSIGSIQINQKNPSEIWVGTGEGNPRNSQNSGAGVFRSLDGGKTWTCMGLEDTKVIHRIVIHRDHPNVVYVGAQGSAWGPSTERGVFRTKDGGKTWEKILYVGEEVGVADMVVDPTNPNKMLVAMWEFGRQPHTFNSGGAGSGIYITYDGGDTWKKIPQKNGLPKGDLGRIGLAIAPSQPNLVYALVEAKKNGLYKSTDGGHHWKLVADKNIGNRPFYYADIFVDPQNENRIYNLFSIVTRSEDGGKTFEPLLPFNSFSGVHPDYHAFWVHPHDPSHIMLGNDGGFVVSKDRGNTWQFSENLPLAQFYHINYDMEIPYNVCGGMQDNGSWIGPSVVWKSGGIKNADWQEVLFGDGFDVVIRPDNSRYGYAMYQGGNVYVFDKKTGNRQIIKPIHPDGEKLRFNWNAAIAQNPFHDCGLYFGSQFVHKSMDCGQSWEIISPDLTTNDPDKQKQGESGGLTIDATRAENFTTIVAIAPSPLDEATIWVGTDDGNLQLTRNGGQTWNNLSARLPDFPTGAWIPQIEVSQHDAGEAFVVVNDYRRNNWNTYLYHTTDYGNTWRQLADSKQIKGHALSVVQDPEVDKLLFLGTDQGLYLSFDKGRHWQQWTHGFPAVCTSDLKIHPREHDLIIGTFGRAAYILDDIRPLREIARSEGKVLQEGLTVFPAADAYLATYRSVDGARFIADAEFVGENRPRGAVLSFYVNMEKTPTVTATPAAPKSKKKKEKQQPENIENPISTSEKETKKDKKETKAQVYVLHTNGDTLRTFSTKIDTGMNRIVWDLRQNGVRYPSFDDPKPDADPPSGRAVLPGTYRVTIAYDNLKDSTQVKVLPDPRIPYNLMRAAQADTAIAEYEAMVAQLTKAFNQLKDAEKTVNMVEKQWTHIPDSLKQALIDEGKTMQDTLQKMMEQILLPKDYKGLNREYPALIYNISEVGSYVYDSPGIPNETTQWGIEQVRKKIAAFLKQTNGFFEKEWTAYRQKVEAAPYSLFKETRTIRLE